MYRDGPIGKRHKSLPWFRLVALAAACLATLLVASGIWLLHTDAPGSESTCPICHVAHMPVLPGMATSIVTAHKVIAWVAPPKPQEPPSVFAGLDSPPRAPPA